MKKLLFVLCGLLVCYLNACKKKDSTDSTNCPMVLPELHSAFNFKLGSYWIYRDSATGVQDSFAVVKWDSGLGTCYHSEVNLTPGRGCFQHIFINFGIYEGGTWVDSVSWSLFSNTLFNENKGKFVQSGAIPFLSYSGLPQRSGPDSCIVTTADSPLIVSGTSYTHVTALHHKSAYTVYYDDIHYFKEGIGILKMRLKRYTVQGTSATDSSLHTWELLRYKIN